MVDNIGRSGGITVMWKKEVQVELNYSFQSHISLIISNYVVNKKMDID